MVKIVGVRFRNAGKVYYFDPKQYELKSGDHVIVETARGIEYGTVVGGLHMVEEDRVVQPLRAVLREATEEDNERARSNREREKEALQICAEKVRRHHLEMKLIDAEYTFDNSKLLFYFTADGRIDFRELVKDLAAVFRMRIELRQVGVRDETKILGGIGICGRVLCCHSYLSDFAPVSIRMAKEQNLSLNPTKISGACGRLMCCLKNEQETYEYLNSQLPGNGDAVLTMDGQRGVVQGVDVLRQRVRVLFDENGEKEITEFSAKELQFRPRRRKGGKGGQKETADTELQEDGIPEEPLTRQSGRKEEKKEEKKDAPRREDAKEERKEERREGRRSRDRRREERNGSAGWEDKNRDRTDREQTNRKETREEQSRAGRRDTGGREPRGEQSRADRGDTGEKELREERERAGRRDTGGREPRGEQSRADRGDTGEKELREERERTGSEGRRHRNHPYRGNHRPRADHGGKEDAQRRGEPS